jgi:hypothetical protein
VTRPCTHKPPFGRSAFKRARRQSGRGRRRGGSTASSPTLHRGRHTYCVRVAITLDVSGMLVTRVAFRCVSRAPRKRRIVFCARSWWRSRIPAIGSAAPASARSCTGRDGKAGSIVCTQRITADGLWWVGPAARGIGAHMLAHIGESIHGLFLEQSRLG